MGSGFTSLAFEGSQDTAEANSWCRTLGSTPSGSGSAKSHFAGQSSGTCTIDTAAAAALVSNAATFCAKSRPAASLSGQITTDRPAITVQLACCGDFAPCIGVVATYSGKCCGAASA